MQVPETQPPKQEDSNPTTPPATSPQDPFPANRNQEAVAMAVSLASSWFPTDRHSIERILTNPSLEEGFEGFTESEAAFAVENADIDWNEHALYKAYAILANNENINYSQRDLYYDVEHSGDICGCAGFTEDELRYAVYNCGIDWQARVISDMKSYWDNDYNVIVTLYDFCEYLAAQGYDDDTIAYAINNTSGYYRGEAVESEQERVKLLLTYGYTREAIINWYCKSMDRAEAEELVDSCL